MSTTRSNQPQALIDGLAADLGGPRTAALLERLDQVVPWRELAEPVSGLYRVEAGGAGRRPWDPVLMLKCLLLQKWFGLSDPMLEEMLQDRLSFRRFVGLSLTDATPDETTFVVFRRRLREAELDTVLFERALAHLDQQGLVVKEGTLVDATILEAPHGRAKTDDQGNKVGHTCDAEASFTKKHGRPRPPASENGMRGAASPPPRKRQRSTTVSSGRTRPAGGDRNRTKLRPAIPTAVGARNGAAACGGLRAPRRPGRGGWRT